MTWEDQPHVPLTSSDTVMQECQHHAPPTSADSVNLQGRPHVPLTSIPGHPGISLLTLPLSI